MNRKFSKWYVLSCVFLVVILASGCAEEEAASEPDSSDMNATGPDEAMEVRVEVLDAPNSVKIGDSFEVLWEVNSSVEMEIPHTALHYGPESVIGELTVQSYPFLTVPKEGMVPARFEDSLVLEEAGTVFYRAHAVVDGINYWSDEGQVTVLEAETATGIIEGNKEETETEVDYVSGLPAEVKVLDPPLNVESGKSFVIRWEVLGGTPGDIEETAVLRGSESGSENLVAYPTKSTPQTGQTPREFEVNVRAPLAGKIYFRAYAVVDGTEIFSREYQIPVTGSTGY